MSDASRVFADGARVADASRKGASSLDIHRRSNRLLFAARLMANCVRIDFISAYCR